MSHHVKALLSIHGSKSSSGNIVRDWTRRQGSLSPYCVYNLSVIQIVPWTVDRLIMTSRNRSSAKWRLPRMWLAGLDAVPAGPAAKSQPTCVTYRTRFTFLALGPPTTRRAAQWPLTCYAASNANNNDNQATARRAYTLHARNRSTSVWPIPVGDRRLSKDKQQGKVRWKSTDYHRFHC